MCRDISAKRNKPLSLPEPRWPHIAARAAEHLACAFDGFEQQITQADDVTIQQYGEDILVAWQTVLDEFEAEDNDKTVRLGASRRR